MPRYLLVGNYGVENFGDEAMKDYFLQRFPQVQWIVVSPQGKGGHLPLFPAGLRSALRPWWRTLVALRAADGLVFGGGTLLTDVESVRACWIWWCQAFVAFVFRRPIIFAFQGVGPWETRVGKWLSAWVIRRSSYISVRDVESYQRVAAILQSAGKNTEVVQTFDCAYSLMEKEIVTERTKKLIIIPRSNSTEEFFQKFIKISSSQLWDKVLILSLDPRFDQKSIRRIEEHMTGCQHCSTVIIRSIGELTEAMTGASYVLSQRYHGAIGALALHIPFDTVPQTAGDKLDALMHMDPSQCTALVALGGATLERFLMKR